MQCGQVRRKNNVLSATILVMEVEADSGPSVRELFLYLKTVKLKVTHLREMVAEYFLMKQMVPSLLVSLLLIIMQKAI